MSKLITTATGNLTPEQAQRVKRYAKASRAKSTLDGYKIAMKRFTSWCREHGHEPVPASPDVLAAFVADMAQHYRPSSINVLVSAIAHAHRLKGLPFDRKWIDVVSSGIRREHGVKPKQMQAITADELRALCATLPDTVKGKRDRALLLIGFAGALRRSELVGLDIGEPIKGNLDPGTGLIEIVPEGLRLTLHKSKTDQEGKGVTKGIPGGSDPAPLAALKDWLAASEITSGAVFRPIDKGGRISAKRMTPKAVERIIRRIVYLRELARGRKREEAVAIAKAFAGHSLRSGFATSAAAANVTGENIARHVGWTTSQMAQRYIREAELFKNNPLRRVLG